jgi:putative transposase
MAAAGGPPKVLRMDNGLELVSQALQRFCDNKVGLLYIPPGTPWNNGYIESFNNRLRRSASTATTGTPCSRPAWSSGISRPSTTTETGTRPWGYRTPAEYAASCRCTDTPMTCVIN